MLSVIHRTRRQSVAVMPLPEVTLQSCFRDRPASNERSNLGSPHRLRGIRRPEAKLRGICFSKAQH